MRKLFIFVLVSFVFSACFSAESSAEREDQEKLESQISCSTHVECEDLGFEFCSISGFCSGTKQEVPRVDYPSEEDILAENGEDVESSQYGVSPYGEVTYWQSSDCSSDSECFPTCFCSQGNQACFQTSCQQGKCHPVEGLIVVVCSGGCRDGQCYSDSEMEEEITAEEDISSEPEDVVSDSEMEEEITEEEDLSSESEDVVSDSEMEEEITEEEDFASEPEDVVSDSEMEEEITEEGETPFSQSCEDGSDCGEGEFCGGEGCLPSTGKVIFTVEGCSLPWAIIWYGVDKQQIVACGEELSISVSELCLWGTKFPTFKFNLTDKGYEWGGGTSAYLETEFSHVLIPDAEQGNLGKAVVSWQSFSCLNF